jgi:hypothetical protein
MKAGDCWISKTKKSAPLLRRDTAPRAGISVLHHHHPEYRGLSTRPPHPVRRGRRGNSSYKVILKQSAKEFAKYNQLYPDQFTQMQRDMINSFGSAKDQWFSSFMLQVEAHTPGIVCSSIPSAGQCTPQAAAI